MTQVALFLVTVFGVSWALCLALRPFAAPAEVWPVLAWLLPTVWTPTAIALILARSAGGPGAVRKEIRARLNYRCGSGPWLVIAGIVPALATAGAVLMARAAGDGEGLTRVTPLDPPTAWNCSMHLHI